MRTRNASKVRLQVELLEGRIPPSIFITSAVALKSGAVLVSGTADALGDAGSGIFVGVAQGIGRLGSKGISASGDGTVDQYGHFTVMISPFAGKFVPGSATISAFVFNTGDSTNNTPVQLTR
jgi:hypothetical protein